MITIAISYILWYHNIEKVRFELEVTERGYDIMKRNIVLCAALAAVISLSACGANGETAETTSKSAQEQTTISESAEDNEADEEETTAETTAETEPEEEASYKISSWSVFRNGTFAFEVPARTGRNSFIFTILLKKR